MAYQANHGPGHPGYDSSTPGGGVNEAYFDKEDDESPFEHYKDNQYNNNDDNPLSGDYTKNQEEEQKKDEEKKENTLIDNIKKEEEKAKETNKLDRTNITKKAADEIRHEQLAASNRLGNPTKKKNESHKSIEEAIKDASKDKKEVFVLK